MTMTRLGDVMLSVAEVRALKRMLEMRVTGEDRALERQVNENAQRNAQIAEARATQIYEAIRGVATATAQADGVTTIPPYLQSRAAWEAFIANEGHYSTYDVTEHWEPRTGDDETWELAYVAELERIKILGRAIATTHSGKGRKDGASH